MSLLITSWTVARITVGWLINVIMGDSTAIALFTEPNSGNTSAAPRSCCQWSVNRNKKIRSVLRVPVLQILSEILDEIKKQVLVRELPLTKTWLTAA